MTAVTRYVALLLLFGSWALVVVVPNPVGRPLQNGSPLANVWPYIWLGLYAAFPCLFAVWIALGTADLSVRIPSAVGLAAFLGLLATWAQPSDRRADIDFLLFALFVTCLDALILGLLRLRYGWQIGIKRSDDAPRSPRLQFTTLKLLIWTTGTAFLLGFATLIVGDWDQVSASLRSQGWLGPRRLGVFVLSLLTLPFVIPATGVILADGRRRRFGVWLVGVVMFLLLAICFLIFFAAMNSGGADALIIGLVPLLMLSGFVVTFAGSLLICRLCGFRMS